MRDIVLDLSCLKPGNLSSQAGIGCAMGEVLFQAGVPWDIMCKRSNTQKLLVAFPQVIQLLTDFLGKGGFDPNKHPSSHFSGIEFNFDMMMERLNELTRPKDEIHIKSYVQNMLTAGTQDPEKCAIAYANCLMSEGKRCGINFVIASPLHMRGACPLDAANRKRESELVAV